MAFVYMYTLYEDMVEICPVRKRRDQHLLAQLQQHNISEFPLPLPEFTQHRDVLQLISRDNPSLHMLFVCKTVGTSHDSVLVCSKGIFAYFPSQEDAIRSLYNLPKNTIIHLEKYPVNDHK